MTKKDKEIMKLKLRIKELETLLCPIEKHDWEKCGEKSINPIDYTAPTKPVYRCKRCGKVM